MTEFRPLRRVGVVVTALAVIGSIAASSIVSSETDDDPTTVTAVFKNASPLVPGNKVQLHGVQVGTVQDVTLVDRRARVTMELQPDAFPLHTDSTATIRPVSLLGERFVDLGRGSASFPSLGSNPVIPVERTGSAVDLDHLLNTFDDPTSTAAATLVTALGEGTRGRGGDLAAAMKALKPAMSETSALSDILNQQNSILNRLVTTAESNATAFADRGGKTTDRLVDSAERTLATVSANQRGLNDTLVELPDTLAGARNTLLRLSGAADATTPALRSIRPVTRNLNKISSEVRNFADLADPALASLPAVLNRLNAMLDQAQPVVRQLRPAASDLKAVTGKGRQLTDTLFSHRPGEPSALEDLMDGLADWAMATSGRDGLSHYFRGSLVATPEVLTNALNGILPGNGNELGHNTDPDLPRQNARQGSATGEGSGTEPKGATGQQAPRDPANATGLSSTQENALLGQLLGGSDGNGGR